MEWISLLGVGVALAVFIYFAYNGYNIGLLTIIASVIVLVFSGIPWYTGLSQTYMGTFVGFFQKWFLVYLFSSLFARMMSDSGAAYSLAVKIARICKKWPKHQKFLAIMSIPFINSILTYGGVSSLVVVFIMVGLAKDLFRELDIPWHFYGVAALGSATFAVGWLPGAPDVINLTPTTYLGTMPTAAPVLGILGTIMMIAFSLLYVKTTLKKAEDRGETFMPTGQRIQEDSTIGRTDSVEYRVLRSVFPCIVLLVVMNVLKQPPAVALISANIVCLVLFWKKIDLKRVSQVGVPIGINTCVMISGTIAFGAVVTTTSAYNFIATGMDALEFLPPAFQIFICVNVIAALTSSGTPAVTITMQTFAERFLEAGIPAEAIHRLTTGTALALNTLPHSPGVVNAATAAKLEVKEIYRHYLWITVVFPFITAFIIALLITAGFVM